MNAIDELLETKRRARDETTIGRDAEIRIRENYHRSIRDDRRSIEDYRRSIEDYRRSIRDDRHSIEDYRRSIEDYRRSIRDDRRSIEDYRRSIRDDRRSIRDGSRSIRDEILTRGVGWEHQIQDTEHQIQDTVRQIQETERQIQETERQIQETERQIQETERQIQDTVRRGSDSLIRSYVLGNRIAALSEDILILERFRGQPVQPVRRPLNFPINPLPCVKEDQECGITFEEIPIGQNCYTLKCTHVFSDSIVTWWRTEQDATCPLCRGPIE